MNRKRWRRYAPKRRFLRTQEYMLQLALKLARSMR
jgi:hypothetical protein